MFYLTTHSTHFIYGFMGSVTIDEALTIIQCTNLNIISVAGRKGGNVLFNNTLNTFHLWFYGVSDN